MPAIGRLRYVDVPPGESAGSDVRSRGTLVLLHAFPLAADMWAPQFALAERGWRIVAPCVGGLGGGTVPADPSRVRIDDYAAEVIDLLDALHLPDAVVAGLSMGGYVALAMLRLAPRYVRGLVLADTRAQADTPEGIAGRHRMLALLAEAGTAAVVADMMPTLLGETSRREQPGLVDRVQALAASSAPAAVAGAIHALMTRPDATPALGAIHCPTLVMVGEEDLLTPVALGEGLQRGIPGADLEVIPRAGHLANLEQPDAFNAALARFLDTRL